MWCATSSGLYKTINAGLNWSLSVSGGNHRDIEFMPTSSTTIYRSFSNQVFKSINKGVSWALIYTVPGASDIYLSTTPLDSNRLLINADMPGSNYNIYESTDAGASFTAKTSIIGSETGKCLEYSRLNVNTIYGGSLNAWKSNNGGMSWVKMTQWAGSSGPLPEVHADIHHIGFSNNSQHVYFCNDGGLYKYNEVLNSWTNLSNGLLNHLIYRIANGTNSSVFMLTGTQDNGGRKRIGQNTWVNANGGDGMEVAIKPGDTNTYYTSYCGGSNLRRTTNGGSNITNIHQLIYNSVATYTARITAPVGKWVTPYDLVPNYPNIIVAGYDTIFRSLDQGNTWLPISGDLSGGWNITDLEISPTNTNVIYASEGVRFYRTLNSGATWSTSVLPGSGQITRIACHPTKSNVLWITKGTYAVNNTAQTKVFKSIDGGVTWQGYDTGLPNVPHNCIIYQNGSADKLFVANDIGVYYRDSTMSSWQPYGSGLPITLCNDLKIQYSGQKLRVGTFGRGIWEVDLCNASIATSINSELVSDESVFVYPNPSNGVFIITNKTIETMEYIKLFSIDGKLLPIEIIESSSIQKIIKTNCVAGIYIIESKVGSKISRFKVIIN